jgi:ketosteroid isomerase-like protein
VVQNGQQVEMGVDVNSSRELKNNKQLVRDFFSRLERGDAQGAFDLFTDDGSWFSPSLRSDIRAAEQLPKIIWMLSKTKDGIRFEFDTFTAEDDRVAVRMKSRATFVDGSEYNQLYHMLFEMRDGQIQHVWEYCDTLHTRETLGGIADFDKMLH